MKFMHFHIKLISLCVFFLLALLAGSCTGAGSNTNSSVPGKLLIDEKEVSVILKKLCSEIPDSSINDLKMARLWYVSTAYMPVWMNNLNGQCHADTLLMFLNKAYEHGIPAFQFDVDTLNALMCEKQAGNADDEELALFELKLSSAFLRYCRAMNFGLIHPAQSIPNYHFKTLTADSVFVAQLFERKIISITQLLNSLQPASEKYTKLQAERRRLSSLPDSISFDPVPYLDKNKTIVLNDSNKLVLLIARRLVRTGDLPDDNRYNSNYMVFDSVLLAAINKIRHKTGQFIDTEIGYNTIRALNYTTSDFIEKIDVNLERLRLKTAQPPGSKFIRINVADMMLEAFRADTLAIRMKVCVGKPPLHKTPFLQSNIDKIILNPVWSIPRNIAVKETSVMAAGDSSYLVRNRIRVYANGEEIAPANADWNAMQNREVTYQLVQDPGGHNALGRIKFSFPNRFAVYLHDTNAKRAFSRHNRAISHGCVRLEKPLELCFFALNDIDIRDSAAVRERLFYQDKIRYTIHQKVITKKAAEIIEKNPEAMKLGTIHLTQKIPLLMDYFTFSIDTNGEIIFRDDIYEMDNYVKQQLKNPAKMPL